jgi:protein-disulfide isomerase
MRPTRFPLALGLIVAILTAAATVAAQTDEELKSLRREIETLKQGQAAMRRQLQELHDVLRARGSAPSPEARGPISLHGAPFKGDPNAAIALVEFSDYECPFCGRYFRDTLGQIERDYIKTGKLKYVFRDFPLEGMHPKAFKAAEAAHCAGEQGRYWQMHDHLFTHQSALGRADLSEHAKTLSLDLPGFEQCLDSERHAPLVRKSLTEGQQAGVGGTPTFFLGRTDADGGSLKTPQTIVGAQPYASFKQALDRLLSGAP